MANEVPDSIKNFPKCLEEALESAVEDTSPPFENIISGLGSFDLSHSPPLSTTVKEESVDSTGNTSIKSPSLLLLPPFSVMIQKLNLIPLTLCLL